MGGIGNTITGGINSVTGQAERMIGLRGPKIPGTEQIGQGQAEGDLIRMASEAFNAGSPMRQFYLDNGMSLLNGTKNVADLPGYANQMGLMERNIGDSFGQARDNILANAPVGNQGAITRSLGAAATGMAEKRGSLAQQIADQMLQQYLGNAFGLASGGLTAGIGGMGAAGGLYNQRTGAGLGANTAAMGAQAGATQKLTDFLMGGLKSRFTPPGAGG